MSHNPLDALTRANNPLVAFARHLDLERILAREQDFYTLSYDARLNDSPMWTPVTLDFSAAELRATMHSTESFSWPMLSLWLSPQPIADWLTPDPLPQHVIDSRPQPESAVGELTRARFYGDSRQTQPRGRGVRAAPDPVRAVRNHGPRRERW
jgi:hypothetical protein